MRLSYCGTAYNGWQVQPHVGTTTVQGMLENVLMTLMRQAIPIVGCGRTDTGVHAKNYIAHFDTDSPLDIGNLINRMNKMLPADIAIHDIYSVKDNSHARFDAVSRSYQYHLHVAKSPFENLSYYYFYERPDLKKLNEVASMLLEYTEFNTFCKLHSDVKTKTCHLKESFWECHGDHYTYRITSDRFLRGMIRLIVGMCLQVARGHVTLDEVRQALETQTRLSQDWSVPAIGLILCDIQYKDT